MTTTTTVSYIVHLLLPRFTGGAVLIIVQIIRFHRMRMFAFVTNRRDELINCFFSPV